MKKAPQFQASVDGGLIVGSAIGLVAITALYTVLAPTNDIRARIPFLLEMSGGGLTLVLLLGLWFVAVVALIATCGISRQSVGGAFVSSFASVSLIISGVPGRLVPEFDSSALATGALGFCVALSVTTLIYQARVRKASH